MTYQPDTRLERLKAWLAGQLPDIGFSIQPASADASFRRYFRVTTAATSYIAMDAPPDKEDSHPFVRIAGYLKAMQVNAPQVLAENYAEGFFLLTDLGDRHYLSVLNQDNAADLYTDAMQALLQIQRAGVQYLQHLPPYDHALLLREMELFREWYLQRHLGLDLDSAAQDTLSQTFEFLAQSALQQPRVFVHRDYHSRNLMYGKNGVRNPGILDFQDAVAGPLTYDLVSLLRDCYISWPAERLAGWTRYYYDQLQAHGWLADIEYAQFMRWFDLMGIQRHLKASGIFARLNHRDGKPGYLADIPRTLGYILDIAPAYDELHDFTALLHRRVAPSLTAQGFRERA